MSDDYVATIRIRRPARVSTDGGRNVWEGTIETVQLELVSESQLQEILDSEDEDTQGAIRQVLSGQEEGVLARDPATGMFQVISDDDLQAILDENDDLPIRRRPANATLEPAGGDDQDRTQDQDQELSLVSTQMLRKIIKSDDGKPAKPVAGVKPKKPKDRSGGFDPYNSG